MVGAAEDGLRAPRALDALGRGHGAPFAAPLDASRAARPAPPREHDAEYEGGRGQARRLEALKLQIWNLLRGLSSNVRVSRLHAAFQSRYETQLAVVMRDALGENKARELAGEPLKFVKKYLKDVAYLKRGRALGVSNGHEHHEEYLFPRDDFTPKSIPEPTDEPTRAPAADASGATPPTTGANAFPPPAPSASYRDEKTRARASPRVGVSTPARHLAGSVEVGRSRSTTPGTSAPEPPADPRVRRRAENGATESFADGVGGAPPRGPPATSGTPADHPGSARGCDAAGGGEGIPADPGSTETDRGYPSRSSERRYAENVSLLTLETARLRADLVRVAGERDAARVETLGAKEEAREDARAFSARVESLEREVRDLRSEVARREEELADRKRSYAAISFSAASEALRRSRAEADLRRVSEECAKLRAKCEAAATAATASTTLDEAEAERLGKASGGATAARGSGFLIPKIPKRSAAAADAGAAPSDEPSASRGAPLVESRIASGGADSGECVVCMEAFEGEDERARYMLWNCKHARTCGACALKIWRMGKGKRFCPTCRRKIDTRPERHVVYT